MKYRAQLFGVPNLERTLQKFGDSLGPLEDWARAILVNFPPEMFPNAYVVVWEMVEREVTRRTHPVSKEKEIAAV